MTKAIGRNMRFTAAPPEESKAPIARMFRGGRETGTTIGSLRYSGLVPQRPSESGGPMDLYGGCPVLQAIAVIELAVFSMIRRKSFLDRRVLFRKAMANRTHGTPSLAALGNATRIRCGECKRNHTEMEDQHRGVKYSIIRVAQCLGMACNVGCTEDAQDRRSNNRLSCRQEGPPSY